VDAAAGRISTFVLRPEWPQHRSNVQVRAPYCLDARLEPV
jgi:hypothetical protein